jgi:hypothetical protein
VGLRVLPEEFVEDGVGNLVSDFVGMTFGDGLRCEKVIHLFSIFDEVASKQIFPR